MSFQMRLDSRCQELLNWLMENNDYISVVDIASYKNVSKRSVYYDLCKINDWLDLYKIPRIEIERSKGVFMSEIQKELVMNIIEDTSDESNYVFSPMERIRIIICYIINADKAVYIEDLMNFCEVSRNTVFNDLKVVANKLLEYDLTLMFENRKGYQIQGDTIRKRAIFFLNFNFLITLFQTGTIKLLNKGSTDEYLNRLKEIEMHLNMKYVDGMLLSLAQLLPVMINNNERVNLDDVDIAQIEETLEYELVTQYFPELVKDECCYLSLHLLGSRIQNVPIDFMKNNKDKEVYELAKALVSEFKKIACVEFDKQEDVERSLFVHLKASLYRYRYGIQLGNPLIDDIVKEYPNLFEITKKASEYLTQQNGVPIPDTEIAYLTLHFGGFLRLSKSKSDVLQILIVCPNGISTGNMLRGEVTTLLPNANIMGVASISEITEEYNSCDLIISTVKVKSKIPVLVVHPVLSDNDRITILKRSINNASLKVASNIDVDSLYNLVSKYVDVSKQTVLRKDIENYLFVNQNNIEITHRSEELGILKLLNEQKIRICGDTMEWKDSLYYASLPLLENNSIKEDYINNIITQIKYYGPYMFIAPNIVLAHAKPEDGTNHLDLSIALFKKDVPFMNHHNAKIVIVLSPIDQESHLHILRDIMSVFSIQTNVDNLLQLEDESSVIEFFKQNLE
ncbi:MAG: BglG family transcription antiterminator [Longicatena sp.]